MCAGPRRQEDKAFPNWRAFCLHRGCCPHGHGSRTTAYFSRGPHQQLALVLASSSPNRETEEGVWEQAHETGCAPGLKDFRRPQLTRLSRAVLLSCPSASLGPDATQSSHLTVVWVASTQPSVNTSALVRTQPSLNHPFLYLLSTDWSAPLCTGSEKGRPSLLPGRHLCTRVLRPWE